MSTVQRLGFAAVAVVIAVVAVVVLGGAGSDDEGTKAGTSRAAAPREATPASSATPTPTPSPTATPAPATRVVRVRNGEVVGGRARLTFEKGETARFAIALDEADEVHVHGYDLEREVPAGGVARFAFRADIEGIFEVELHHSELEVAQLRIEP